MSTELSDLSETKTPEHRTRTGYTRRQESLRHPAVGMAAAAVPALVLAVVMLGLDAWALIPLGSWMRAYGVAVTLSAYLCHLAVSAALAGWALAHLTARTAR